jgi:NAD(P)H dehydrogenase (quinone)
MIAITGANGNLGKTTISFLLKKMNASNIVAIVRNAEKMKDYADSGMHIRIADYQDPKSLQAALKGVDKLLQISSSSYGKQADIEENNVVQAAKEQGVRYIVYTSILHPGTDVHFIAGHTCMNTEQAIKAAGMHYTIFRNSMYSETIPLYIGAAIENGQIHYPGGEGKISFVSRADIAEALSNVLSSGEHENKVYKITGDKAYGFSDIADLLHSFKGMEARYIDIPKDVYRQDLLQYGMTEEEVPVYLSIADSIQANEFAYVDDSLERLLKRKRVTVEEYVKSIV